MQRNFKKINIQNVLILGHVLFQVTQPNQRLFRDCSNLIKA